MHITHTLSRILIAGLTTVLLASCGGGGSSSTPVVASPQGIYYGTGKFASGAGNNTLMLVEADNTYWILYMPPSVLDAVPFIDTGVGVSTAVTFEAASDTDYSLLYDDPKNSNAIVPSGATTGAVATGYTVSMDYTNLKQIDGSILNGKTVISVIVPLYVANSTNMQSLNNVAGKYSGNLSTTLNTSTLQAAGCVFALSMDVGSNGKITGTLDDCSGAGLPSQSTVTGTLTPRTDLYAFDVSLTFTSGGADSNPLDGLTFSGVVYYNATQKRFDMGATDGSAKDAIGLSATGPN